MPKFRKKPVVIEAVRWDKGRNTYDQVEQWGAASEHCTVSSVAGALVIDTLEGAMTANIGDWIIRGVKGELYPIKDQIFQETYEPAE